MRTEPNSGPIVRVAVLGAGAMGCLFAARIHEAGADVDLLDVSADRVSAINQFGLDLDDDQGRRNIHVRALTAADLDYEPDLIVVFTKSMHTRAAIASVRDRIGPSSWVLTLQNGLGNADIIATSVAEECIIVGVTDVPADFHEPASVVSHGAGKILFFDHLGRGPLFLRTLSELLRRARFDPTIDPEVKTAIWEKVTFNAALNSTAAVINQPVGALNNSNGLDLIRAVVGEAVAVAHRYEISVDRQRIEDRIRYALSAHASHKPSMLQDVLAGRTTEIDSINGAIVAAGELKSVPTPVNRALSQLVKMLEPASLQQPSTGR
jgi:2-dehydropantoate 2-reductase